MAAVYTDAVHIADGVVSLKQRSRAASDPRERPTAPIPLADPPGSAGLRA
jgi:hypothetical protein